MIHRREHEKEKFAELPFVKTLASPFSAITLLTHFSAVKKISMTTLIKNGRIITATDDYSADILIEGETIKAIGKDLQVKADKEIDATGKLIIPGGIDPHVHLDMPFMGTYSSDNYETGTRAALFGGTTMVIDFILQKQGNSLQAALDEWRGRSNGSCRRL